MPETSTRALRASTNLRALAQRIQPDAPVTAQAIIQIQNWIDTTEQRLRQLTQPNTSSRTPFALDIDGTAILDGTLRVEALIATIAWITTAMIEDLAVTTAKIADLAVTTAKIDNLAVTAAQIANATITSAKIASLTADLITAGTLNAAIVNLINVNAASINAGFLSADRIQGGTLDITKLSLRMFVSSVQFSNGTPVTWLGTFAVYLDGVTYPINAGSTSNRYIWFEPTVSTTVLQTSNSFTPSAGRFRIAVNDGGTVTEVWRQDAPTEITAAMMGQASVTGGASGAIAASTITSDNVLANSIRADRLVIGNFENLAEDPGFEANSISSWSAVNSNFTHSNDGQARSGSYALKKTSAIADDESLSTIFVPCAPGDTFYAEAYLKGTGNGTGKIRISFYATDKTTRTTFDSSTVSATSAYVLASVSATCPASRVYARVSILGNSHTSGSWYADDVFFKRKSPASFIESLNADVINAGELTIGGSASNNPQISCLDFADAENAWLGLRQEATLAVGFASWTAPIIVTTATHGYATGDKVYITGVIGNTAANGVWTITVTSTTQFSLNGSSGNGTHTGGGTVARIFEGGWLKALRIGGSSAAAPKITAFNDGSVLISGANFTLTSGAITIALSDSAITGIGVVGVNVRDSGGGYSAMTSGTFQLRNITDKSLVRLLTAAGGGEIYVSDGSGSGGIDGVGSNVVIDASSGLGGTDGRVKVRGDVYLTNGTAADDVIIEPGKTTTATAGAGTLPANPVGFLKIQVGGTAYRVPYYAV